MPATRILHRPRVAQALARYVAAQNQAAAQPAHGSGPAGRAPARRARSAQTAASAAARDLERALDEAVTSYVELHLYINRLLSDPATGSAMPGAGSG